MKLIKETDQYYEYYDEIFGTVKLQKWSDFIRQKEIADNIDGVNEKELQEGYEELCKEYIGAP
jgi:hypothetical protein